MVKDKHSFFESLTWGMMFTCLLYGPLYFCLGLWNHSSKSIVAGILVFILGVYFWRVGKIIDEYHREARNRNQVQSNRND